MSRKLPGVCARLLGRFKSVHPFRHYEIRQSLLVVLCGRSCDFDPSCVVTQADRTMMGKESKGFCLVWNASRWK